MTTSGNPPAPIYRWQASFCGPRLEHQINRLAGLPDVAHVAVMPDLHEGKNVPNGVVVATNHLIYPDLVGSDIGCGISALGFRESADRLRTADLQQLLGTLARAVPTLKQPPSAAARLRHSIEALGDLSCEQLTNHVAREGRYQLGTLGRGNHFLELTTASDGRIWAVVHTGSRAMGQLITTHHLREKQRNSGHEASDISSLDIRLPPGQGYYDDMKWACRYATLNRQIILNTVADLLESFFQIEVDEKRFIDSPHNIASQEQHQERLLLVHRKSANIATQDRLGLIAGSMQVGSRIVRGLGNLDSLHSSSHGAGRLFSRSQAAETLSVREMNQRMRSVVWHEKQAPRLIDESPQAYRDLREVMALQRDLVKTIDVLTPLLNDKRV